MPTTAERLTTLRDRLAAVEASIARAQEAQAYEAEGRSIQRGNLFVLLGERRQLETEIAQLERRQRGRGRGFIGVPL